MNETLKVTWGVDVGFFQKSWAQTMRMSKRLESVGALFTNGAHSLAQKRLHGHITWKKRPATQGLLMRTYLALGHVDWQTATAQKQDTLD
jgi:hypothetical protein